MTSTRDRERENLPYPQMCMVCREPVTPIGPTDPDKSRTDVANYRWVHGHTNVVHEPVLAPLLDDKDVRLICDFCGAYHPTWDFPCGHFVQDWETPGQPTPAGKPAGFDSGNEWTACDTCCQLILDEQYDKLAKRAIKQCEDPSVTPRERMILLHNMRSMHEEFRKNRSGPPTPIDNAIWIASQLSTIFHLGE